MKFGLKKFTYLLSLIFLINCSAEKQSESSSSYSKEEIEITTADSIKVFGDIFIVDESAPFILLFHQGGSNARAEYGNEIIPELLENGFNILSIDQRRGGQTYGSYNRTVGQFSINRFSYCDAYPDLEAAMNYLIKQRRLQNKLIVWGSSYSASLAIQLAAKNQDKVSGVLAFSPASGGPMAPCKPDEYFEQLTIPLLVLRPSGEMEIESVQQQFQLVESSGHQTYVADPGVHGSSMLVKSRVEAETEESWNSVLEFINSVIDEN